VLYQPRVRECRRHPDKPSDSAVEPEHADLASAREELESIGADSEGAGSEGADSESADSEDGSGDVEAGGEATATAGGLLSGGNTSRAMTPDVPDQVSRKEHKHDDVVAPKTKMDRIILVLSDLDKQGRFKLDMMPAEVEKIVKIPYKYKWEDFPGRDQIKRAYDRYCVRRRADR
jgi:hypothetical protein